MTDFFIGATLIVVVGTVVGFVGGFFVALRVWHRLDQGGYHKFYPIAVYPDNPVAPLAGPCMWCK